MQINNISTGQISESDLIKLSQPSLFSWSWRLLLDWSLIGLILFQAKYFNNIFSYAIAIIGLGTMQHALGILGHDGAHRRITKNKKLNDFLSTIFCFAPLLMPLRLYRDFHFSHHRHLGTALDGEVEYKKEFSPIWDLPIKKHHIEKNLLLDYLGFGVPILIRMAKSTNEATFSDQLPIYLFWTITTITMYTTNTLWILPIWFIASGTSFWAAFRFRLWCEHMGTSGTYRYQTNFLQRLLWLPHNIDIHWEHHKYPSIPLWNLTKIRKLTIDSMPIVSLNSVLKSLENLPQIPSGSILSQTNEDNTPFIIDEAS